MYINWFQVIKLCTDINIYIYKTNKNCGENEKCAMVHLRMRI